jgi:hypothetical protein
MQKFVLLCWVWLMLGVEGCVIIPAPSKPLAGTRIEASQLRFITPGVTEDSQVLRELGRPDWRFQDIRVLAYSWVMRTGYSIDFGGNTERLGQAYDLFIELDEQNDVQRFETVKRGVHDTVRSQAVAWAKGQGNRAAAGLPARFVGISVPAGKSVIHIYRPGGFEVPLVAVRVVLDGETLADLRSKECISLVTKPGTHSVLLHPHPLASASGAYDLRVVDGETSLEVRTNDAVYIRLTVPAGRGRLEPLAKTVPENEAMPSLKELKPW